ncbi:MAG: hypothetical protein QNJ30_27505 [Kiloniellales bacterium]|nr:hypothetical protein [Kiloniellales bacterium]
MRSLWIAALLCFALSSCANDEQAQANLAVACAVKKCICEAKETPFFSQPERQDVLWQGNGNAYCPQGFALAEYVEKKKDPPGGLALPKLQDPYPCYDTSARCKNQESLQGLQ